MMPGLDNVTRELLPKSVQDFVDVIGLAATIQLIKQYGGTRVYVPGRMKQSHPLAKCIGYRAALKLVENWHGDLPEFPLAHDALRAARNSDINRRLDEGESASALAREYRTTRRNIFMIRKNHRHQAQQPTHNHSLF